MTLNGFTYYDQVLWIQQPYLFSNKSEYNATLAITEAITGSSLVKLYQELALGLYIKALDETFMFDCVL